MSGCACTKTAESVSASETRGGGNRERRLRAPGAERAGQRKEEGEEFHGADHRGWPRGRRACEICGGFVPLTLTKHSTSRDSPAS